MCQTAASLITDRQFLLHTRGGGGDTSCLLEEGSFFAGMINSRRSDKTVLKVCIAAASNGSSGSSRLLKCKRSVNSKVVQSKFSCKLGPWRRAAVYRLFATLCVPNNVQISRRRPPLPSADLVCAMHGKSTFGNGIWELQQCSCTTQQQIVRALLRRQSRSFLACMTDRYSENVVVR